MERAQELQGLMRWLGDWDLAMLIRLPDGSELRGQGTVCGQAISLGQGVLTRLQAQVDGLGAYEENVLWGYDMETRTVHAYAITSTGSVHDHVGRWISDRAVVFQWEGVLQGQVYEEQVSVTWESIDRIAIHEVDSINHGRGPISDYTLTRK